MAEKSPFRKKSLERLSSPERLDQLLRVIDRKSWIPLLAASILIVILLGWSVFGRVPVNAWELLLVRFGSEMIDDRLEIDFRQREVIVDDERIRRYFELGCEVKGMGRGHIQRIKEEVRAG